MLPPTLHLRVRCLAAGAGAMLLTCTLARAGQEPVRPNAAPPVIQAASATTPPVIDGVLDDPCWQDATHIEEFRREKVDAPALERTEAWICCDGDAIYAAFRCHDSKPAEIRCDQKKRQGHIWRDDRVLMGLNTDDTGRGWYNFHVTPAGTQYDDVPGGTSEKIEWKGDWRAAAKLNDCGWSAEIEVPFSILRYPQGQDTFRIYLSRELAREDDWATWPPAFARVWDTDNSARWTGLATPPVPFRCVFMPYLLTVASEDEEDREPVTGGLDFKGTFPNSVVALAAYNPDFRNIEDVVETIDFTYVERYLPEYRPFFREGEWYLPPDRIFYSRRVEELDVGLKTFGSLAPHRFGVLDVYRRGGENHLACCYEHLFGTKGSVEFYAADRRVPEEPHNLAYGLETNWSQNLEGGGRWLQANSDWSRTDGSGGDDSSMHVGTGLWRIQGIGWFAGYGATGSSFQADDGYVPETGVRTLGAGLDYHRSYDEGPLQWIETHLHGHTGDSEDGTRRGYWFGHDWHWRSGRSLWLGTSSGERDGFDDAEHYIGGCWNRNDIHRTGSAGYSWGEHYGYPYRYPHIEQVFGAGGRWSAELRVERIYAADLDDDGNVIPPEYARQIVLTNTYDFTEERTISARLVRSAGNTNAYAAYRQRVRKGTDILIVIGDPNADKWVSRLAVKAIWCY